MQSYEVTFIVDATLDNKTIKSTAKKYQDLLVDGGSSIVALDEIGLRQLAYPIRKRNSGMYYSIEFQTTTPTVIQNTEVNMHRDSSILRFLTVSLDKYGVKYNADKRAGLIGKARKKVTEEIKEEKESARRSSSSRKSTPKKEEATPVAEPKVTPAPIKAAPTAKAAPIPVKEEIPAPTAKAAPIPVKEEISVPIAKAEPTPVKEEKATPVKKAKKDDLKKIEGIGPKIAEVLNNNGVNSFKELSDTKVDTIKGWLTEAGSRFAIHNPSTWPFQAGLAAETKWDELKEWQDKSDGGKPVS